MKKFNQLNIIALLICIIGFSQENNKIKYSNIYINGISINQTKNNIVTNLNLIDSGDMYTDEIANEESAIYTLNNNLNDLKSEFYFATKDLQTLI